MEYAKFWLGERLLSGVVITSTAESVEVRVTFEYDQFPGSHPWEGEEIIECPMVEIQNSDILERWSAS